ncbi:RodZ domain-containing protein [Paenibacillus sp. XY044]|uniref:helix-turn-helix domain-containing protein n=1 Tax=Paenibacillus sp. XY044 TaxID=2026089 RepID=UPI000B97CBB9|nr:RodZ domain-containing protein [Paenibacillus sp. XY044]OZB97866.1 helix-turn-helix domain-containing protein [Paenibacillus sp. XY044]
MSELGQQLKEARLQKGMSLDDVQEMTKIRKRYLEAIEAGDYKVLPGSFYVRAFIKTYAETVGLDPDVLLEGHKKEAPPEPEATMEPVIQKRSSSRSSSPERNVKWLSTVLMWTFPILIIVVIYLYANNASSPKKDNSIDSSKVTEQQDSTTAQNQDPPATTTPPDNTTNPGDNGGKDNTGNSDTTTDNTNTDSGNTGGKDTTTPPDQGSTDPSGNGTDTSGTGTDSTDTTNQGSQGVTVTQDGKKGKNTIFKVAAAQGTPVQVEIKATGKSWLEVYKGENTSGEKLSYGNTKEGDTLTFTLDSSGMYIKSGYSPATTITVAGQTVEDGKSTSRILLKLDDAGGTSTGTDQATGDSSGNESDSSNG